MGVTGCSAVHAIDKSTGQVGKITEGPVYSRPDKYTFLKGIKGLKAGLQIISPEGIGMYQKTMMVGVLYQVTGRGAIAFEQLGYPGSNAIGIVGDFRQPPVGLHGLEIDTRHLPPGVVGNQLDQGQRRCQLSFQLAQGAFNSM